MIAVDSEPAEMIVEFNELSSSSETGVNGVHFKESGDRCTKNEPP